jgi:hypothetical protein
MIMKKKKKVKNMMIMMMLMLSVYTQHTLLTDDLPVSRTVFWLLRTMDSYFEIWSVYLIDNQLVRYSAS